MTERCTLLDFRLSISSLLAFMFCAGAALAQLPDGPGKAETERLCKACHEVARSVSLRQDRAGWESTMNKMVSLGVKASEKDLAAVLEYLVRNFPAGEVPPIPINKARAIDLQSGLSLKRSDSAAILRFP